jgi:hypothetical protein
MTITLDITLDLRAELARQAAEKGCALEAYAAGLLEEATHLPFAGGAKAAAPPVDERAEAIERLKTFGKRHGLSLGDMTLRELRHEARP